VPNVLCSRCNVNVDVPDSLTQAHCVRCGQALVLETNIMVQAPTPTLPDEPFFKLDLKNLPLELPEKYADWDEFRSTSPAVQRELLHMASRALPDLRSIMPQPVPVDAPEEVERWGRPLGTIDVSRQTGQHWLILGWLMVGLGLLIGAGSAIAIGSTLNPPPGQAGRRLNSNATSYYVLLGLSVVSVAGGGYLAFVQSRRLPTILWLFEEGIYAQHHTESSAFRWEEILDFEVLTRRGSPVYWLRFTRTFTVRISVGSYFETMPLMEYLEIRLCSSQFLHRLKDIWECKRERFGALLLDRAGIEGPRFSAPWSEVRRVITDSKKVFVDWSQRTDWVPVPYQDVSFPYLVIALSSVLIDEYKRIPAREA